MNHVKGSSNCDILWPVPSCDAGARCDTGPNMLTQDDEQDLALCGEVKEFDICWSRGVEFRSRKYQKATRKYDNVHRGDVSVCRGSTVSKVAGVERERQASEYGVITSIHVHRLHRATPPRVIFEVEWKTVCGSLYDGYMPRVRDDRCEVSVEFGPPHRIRGKGSLPTRRVRPIPLVS